MSDGRIRGYFDSALIGSPGALLIVVQNLNRHRYHQLGFDDRVVELQSLLCRTPGLLEGVLRARRLMNPSCR